HRILLANSKHRASNLTPGPSPTRRGAGGEVPSRPDVRRLGRIRQQYHTGPPLRARRLLTHRAQRLYAPTVFAFSVSAQRRRPHFAPTYESTVSERPLP